jgi:hypothetical protein
MLSLVQNSLGINVLASRMSLTFVAGVLVFTVGVVSWVVTFEDRLQVQIGKRCS